MTRGELARKALHVGLSLGAAAVIFLLDPVPAAAVLAGATFVALSVELARRVSAGVAVAFQRLGVMLKDRELGRLTGATTLSVGFTLTALILPGAPALAGILFAGVGDPVAGLVGRRARGPRWPGGKSLAGSAAFLVVALGLGLALGLGAVPSLTTALLLAGVEAFTLPVDDNLYLPLAGAAAVMAVGWLTGV